MKIFTGSLLTISCVNWCFLGRIIECFWSKAKFVLLLIFWLSKNGWRENNLLFWGKISAYLSHLILEENSSCWTNLIYTSKDSWNSAIVKRPLCLGNAFALQLLMNLIHHAFIRCSFDNYEYLASIVVLTFTCIFTADEFCSENTYSEPWSLHSKTSTIAVDNRERPIHHNFWFNNYDGLISWFAQSSEFSPLGTQKTNKQKKLWI